MRWHTDAAGAQWTATVTPEGGVRLLRREVKPPYREGGDPTESYDTYEFGADEAYNLANTLEGAAGAAAEGPTDA
jgi:hypothetical protein